MSDRDELIAKARELSAAATPGPWATPSCPDVVESSAGHRVAEACAGNYVDDAAFIAESRTLLPALADLAESEGRRADEAMKIVEAVRELLAAKAAMLSAISADFMSAARLKYLRKLSKVESLDLPPKEQP